MIGHDDYVKSIIDLILIIKDQLDERYHNPLYLEPKKLRSKIIYNFGPDHNELDYIRQMFIDDLIELNLDGYERYNRVNGMIKSKRYSDIIPREEISLCNISIGSLYGKFFSRRNMLAQNLVKNDMYLTEYDLPFAVGQSDYANMMFIATYDLFMLDWDISPGFGKDEAIKVLERFILSQSFKQERQRVLKGDMCFKIFETDNGIHAYLISHRISHTSMLSTRLMLEVCSDQEYAIMTKITGFSIRLTPKVFKGKQLLPIDYVREQFIQNPGYRKIKYVGNTDVIIDDLEKYTEIIYMTQQNILSYDIQTIYDAIANRNKDIINEWAQYLAKLWIKSGIKFQSDRKAIEWSAKYADRDRIDAVNFY